MQQQTQSPARVAVMTGQGRRANALSGAVVSLLTSVGRWVEEVRPAAALGDFQLVIASDVATWTSVRQRYVGPLLLIDAGLLAGASLPSGVARAGTLPKGALQLTDGAIQLPNALPRLQGTALDGVLPGLGCLLDDHTAYLAPIVLSPSFRDRDGFWHLAAFLDRAVGALLGAAAGPYVEPWPEGLAGARSITCDLDDLDDVHRLDGLAAAGRPTTLFACADGLPPRAAIGGTFEMAGHGDVHRPFADAQTNLSRVDAMLEAFARAGWTPQGFSPPNLVYSSPIAPLAARFRHLRLGYQGASWRFFPTRIDDLIVTRVSFYTDFLHRYVGHTECARLFGAADDWSSGIRALSVPCFHPGLWTEPLREYLTLAAPTAWEADLHAVGEWWRARQAALERLGAGEPIAEPRLVLRAQSLDERLRSVRQAHRATAAAPVSKPRQVGVAGRAFVVVPAGTQAATDVVLPQVPTWNVARWLPTWCRQRVFRVANGGGVTAGLYGALDLMPTVVGDGVRIPAVVPEEPVLLAPTRWREWLRPIRAAGAEKEVTLSA